MLQLLPSGRVGFGQDVFLVENVIAIFGKIAVIHGHEGGRVGFRQNFYFAVKAFVVHLPTVFGIACRND